MRGWVWSNKWVEAGCGARRGTCKTKLRESWEEPKMRNNWFLHNQLLLSFFILFPGSPSPELGIGSEKIEVTKKDRAGISSISLDRDYSPVRSSIQGQESAMGYSRLWVRILYGMASFFLWG